MRRIAPILFLAAGLCVAALPAATPRMPLDEVRPGMRGVGLTVFDGTRREEFGAEVLGVLRNVMGPRRNVIVARLSGGPLAETGVIQGMSGSPVYIDDRLVGAVSYALGSFPREPIAGITPIGEMAASDANRAEVARAATLPPAFPATPADLQAVIGGAFDRTRPFARQPDHVRALGLPPASGQRLGTLLRPSPRRWCSTDSIRKSGGCGPPRSTAAASSPPSAPARLRARMRRHPCRRAIRSVRCSCAAT